MICGEIPTHYPLQTLSANMISAIDSNAFRTKPKISRTPPNHSKRTPTKSTERKLSVNDLMHAVRRDPKSAEKVISLTLNGRLPPNEFRKCVEAFSSPSNHNISSVHNLRKKIDVSIKSLESQSSKFDFLKLLDNSDTPLAMEITSFTFPVVSPQNSPHRSSILSENFNTIDHLSAVKANVSKSHLGIYESISSMEKSIMDLKSPDIENIIYAVESTQKEPSWSEEELSTAAEVVSRLQMSSLDPHQIDYLLVEIKKMQAELVGQGLKFKSIIDENHELALRIDILERGRKEACNQDYRNKGEKEYIQRSMSSIIQSYQPESKYFEESTLEMLKTSLNFIGSERRAIEINQEQRKNRMENISFDSSSKSLSYGDSKKATYTMPFDLPMVTDFPFHSWSPTENFTSDCTLSQPQPIDCDLPLLIPLPSKYAASKPCLNHTANHFSQIIRPNVLKSVSSAFVLHPSRPKVPLSVPSVLPIPNLERKVSLPITRSMETQCSELNTSLFGDNLRFDEFSPMADLSSPPAMTPLKGNISLIPKPYDIIDSTLSPLVIAIGADIDCDNLLNGIYNPDYEDDIDAEVTMPFMSPDQEAIISEKEKANDFQVSVERPNVKTSSNFLTGRRLSEVWSSLGYCHDEVEATISNESPNQTNCDVVQEDIQHQQSRGENPNFKFEPKTRESKKSDVALPRPVVDYKMKFIPLKVLSPLPRPVEASPLMNRNPKVRRQEKTIKEKFTTLPKIPNTESATILSSNIFPESDSNPNSNMEDVSNKQKPQKEIIKATKAKRISKTVKNQKNCAKSEVLNIVLVETISSAVSSEFVTVSQSQSDEIILKAAASSEPSKNLSQVHLSLNVAKNNSQPSTLSIVPENISQIHDDITIEVYKKETEGKGPILTREKIQSRRKVVAKPKKKETAKKSLIAVAVNKVMIPTPEANEPVVIVAKEAIIEVSQSPKQPADGNESQLPVMAVVSQIENSQIIVNIENSHHGDKFTSASSKSLSLSSLSSEGTSGNKPELKVYGYKRRRSSLNLEMELDNSSQSLVTNAEEIVTAGFRQGKDIDLPVVVINSPSKMIAIERRIESGMDDNPNLIGINRDEDVAQKESMSVTIKRKKTSGKRAKASKSNEDFEDAVVDVIQGSPLKKTTTAVRMKQSININSPNLSVKTFNKTISRNSPTILEKRKSQTIESELSVMPSFVCNDKENNELQEYGLSEDILNAAPVNGANRKRQKDEHKVPLNFKPLRSALDLSPIRPSLEMDRIAHGRSFSPLSTISVHKAASIFNMSISSIGSSFRPAMGMLGNPKFQIPKLKKSS